MEVKRDKGYPISGEKIVEWYREAGFNQREFAQKLEMSEAGLRKIESAKPFARVQASTFRAIAAAMNLTPAEAALRLQPGDTPAVPGRLSPEMLERIAEAATAKGMTPDQFVTESLFGKSRKKK